MSLTKCGIIKRIKVAHKHKYGAQNCTAILWSNNMGIDWDNVRYFKRNEFGSHGNIEPCPVLVAKLDKAREAAGVPFVITSGIRSPERNAEVKGSPDSAHLTGHAVDIYAKDSHTRFLIVTEAINAGFRRIGCGRNFVHLDTDPSKPSPRLWTY